MPMVFNFEFHDMRGVKIVSRVKSTLEYISRQGGKIIPETAEIVDASMIYDGNYIPPTDHNGSASRDVAVDASNVIRWNL